MEILDIHTYHIPEAPFDAIWNCLSKNMPFQYPVGYFSVGIHPWYLSEDNFQKQEDWLSDMLHSSDDIVAIGEAGLDKVVNTPWELQKKAFDFQVRLADKVGLPLILHIVKAHNEIIEWKKQYQPHNPWIVHGFRGKKELAEQYLREGFYLSFGAKYNEEALRATPVERMFFETDDSPENIHTIYQRAALALDIPVQSLIDKVQQNIGNVFFTR